MSRKAIGYHDVHTVCLFVSNRRWYHHHHHHHQQGCHIIDIAIKSIPSFITLVLPIRRRIANTARYSRIDGVVGEMQFDGGQTKNDLHSFGIKTVK